MGGVIALTLTACTTDSVFYDVDNPNNSSQTANGNNGGMTTNSYTGDAANPDGYGSHWDIFRHVEMYYHYENTTEYSGTPATRLEFVVTPYIGLAYSDNDVNDDTFFDMSSSLPEGDFINMVSQYPNMFLPTDNEIGNFVPANPITISGLATPLWGNTALRVFSLDHCHVIGPLAPVYHNPNGIFFDISSPPVPYQTSTTLEQDFLSKYGKVFFYYWEARDPATFAVIHSGYVTPYCDTNRATYWQDTNVPASNLPGIASGTARLYENIRCNDTNNPSHELVLETDTYPSETVFTHPGTGEEYRVSIETFRSGYYPYGPGVGGISMGGTISTLKLELN